jgi:hypothetical protein
VVSGLQKGACGMIPPPPGPKRFQVRKQSDMGWWTDWELANAFDAQHAAELAATSSVGLPLRAFQVMNPEGTIWLFCLSLGGTMRLLSETK